MFDDKRQFKPWASFQLAFEPDLIMILIWSSLYYALWYAVLYVRHIPELTIRADAILGLSSPHF